MAISIPFPPIENSLFHAVISNVLLKEIGLGRGGQSTGGMGRHSVATTSVSGNGAGGSHCRLGGSAVYGGPDMVIGGCSDTVWPGDGCHPCPVL